jgi:polysaccharide export outer membrane protein
MTGSRIQRMTGTVLAICAAALVGGPALAAPPAMSFDPHVIARSVDANGDYLLGPQDKISVLVAGEPTLTVEDVQVDASGQIVVPVVGVITAGGKTTKALSAEIATGLGKAYLRNPQVSVVIKDAVSQRVTVTGAVIEAGVYSMTGPTTLMQALAMAKGVDNKVSNNRRVAVFRVINKQKQGAYFDLRAIEVGKAEDPAIYGGDMIVVEGSQGKQFWAGLVSVLPGFGVFGLL